MSHQQFQYIDIVLISRVVLLRPIHTVNSRFAERDTTCKSTMISRFPNTTNNSLAVSSSLTVKQGTHCTGKPGKTAPEKSLSGKTQGIWKFCTQGNHREFGSLKFN